MTNNSAYYLPAFPNVSSHEILKNILLPPFHKRGNGGLEKTKQLINGTMRNYSQFSAIRATAFLALPSGRGVSPESDMAPQFLSPGVIKHQGHSVRSPKKP